MKCGTLLRSVAACVVCALGGADAVADLTIADLAPRQSIALVAVDDYPRLREAFDRSPYAALLKEPEVQKWLHDVFEDLQGDVVRWIEEQGFEANELPQPAGMLGAAIWMDERAASPMIAHALVAVDMGDDADAFEDLLDSLLRRGEDDDVIRVLEDKIEGVDVREIEFVDVDDEMLEHSMFAFATQLFVARLDDTFFVVSDRDALGDTLDRARGEDLDSARDQPALVDANNVVAPAHLTMTVLAEPFFEALDRAMKSDAARESFGDAPPDLQPILQALGLSTIRAAAYGLELNARDAMAVTRLAVLTPHKEGVFELLDVPGGAFEPPAYVTADAAAVRMFRFNFAGILPLLNKVIAAMPEEQRVEMEAMAGMLAASAAPLLQTLGPELFHTRMFQFPFSADSQQQTIGVRTRDAEAVNAPLTQFGQMIGMERTDFQGQTLWKSPGPVLGIAGEFVVLGDDETVPAALRQSVNAQAPKLADEPRFVRAKAFTRPGGVHYSYTDTETVLRYTAWTEEHWEELMRAELTEWGFDDEVIDMWVDEEREMRAEGLTANLPPVDVLLRHLGDVVAETHLTPDGLVSRTGFLPPRK